jgi:hypothetical protein
MLCVLPAGRAGFVCGSGGYDPRNRRQIAMLLASPGRMGCGWDATVGFRPSGIARTRPHEVNAAFMLSQRDAAQLKLIMKICLLPDARRTHWNRAFTASGRPLDPGIHCSERTESGVS